MTIMTQDPMGGNPFPPGNAAPTPAPQGQPVTGQPDYQKMLLARALMGGMGGTPQNSFAGGLAQGMGPALQAIMMQKLMGGGQPQNAPVPPAQTSPTPIGQ